MRDLTSVKQKSVHIDDQALQSRQSHLYPAGQVLSIINDIIVEADDEMQESLVRPPDSRQWDVALLVAVLSLTSVLEPSHADFECVVA